MGGPRSRGEIPEFSELFPPYKYVLCSDDTFMIQTFNLALRFADIGYESFEIISNYGDLDWRLQSKINYASTIFLIERKLLDVKIEYSAQRLKGLQACKTILLSPDFTKEDLVYYFELGFKKFITKPISATRLLEKICSCVTPLSQVEVLIEECKHSIQSRDFQGANKGIEELLHIKPNSTRAYILRGKIFELQHNFQEAEKQYLLAHETEELYIEPLDSLLHLYTLSNQDHKKIQIYERLNTLSPFNFNRRHETLQFLLKQQLSYDLKRELDFLFGNIFSRTDFLNKARIHMVCELPLEEADVEVTPYLEIHCDRLLQRKKMHAFDHCFFIELSNSYLKKNDFEKATSSVSHIPAHKTSDAECMFIKGVISLGMEKYEEALVFFDKVICLKTIGFVPLGEAYYYMACCFLFLQNNEKALRCSRLAYMQSPTTKKYTSMISLIEKLIQKLTQSEVAFKVVRKAFERHPDVTDKT